MAPFTTMAAALRLVAERNDDPSADGELDAQAARIARIVTGSSRRVIGLLPASPSTDALRIAVPIARATVMLSDQTALLFDPEQRSLTAGATGHAVAFAARVAHRVLLVTPPTFSQPGAKSAGIRDLLAFVFESPNAWRAAFVDLGGCALPGELMDVVGLMDGIVIVGTAGRTTEAELRRASARISKDLDLGIVLCDARR